MFDTEDLRRLKRYVLPMGQLVRVFGGRVSLDAQGLPADATVSHVSYDPAVDSLTLFVWSSEFDRVPDGHMIPDAGTAGLRCFAHAAPPDDADPAVPPKRGYEFL